MRMANKVGIVTAAASGMGRAGALRFAAEGAAVLAVDIDAEGVEAVTAQIASHGGRATALAADLRDDDTARRIVAETVNAYGGLDFVWNHLGHPGPAAVEGLDWSAYELRAPGEIDRKPRLTAPGTPAGASP